MRFFLQLSQEFQGWLNFSRRFPAEDRSRALEAAEKSYLQTAQALVLLSQKVAAVVETNHVFGEIHFSACEGLRWVCHDQVTRRRGFRRMSRV